MNYNIILYIKHLFLSFLQDYYSLYLPLQWDYNIQKTKIIIADRTSIDIGVAAKRPSIILSRSDVMWNFLTRGQDGRNVIMNDKYKIQDLAGKGQTSDIITPFKDIGIYTDLLRTGVTFQVITKNGIQSENIANQIFSLLTAYKSDMRKLGIHQFNALSISPEQILKSGAEIELVGINVNLSFSMQHTIYKEAKFYNVYIFIDNTELYENLDFTVISNGSQIKLKNEATAIPLISYKNAITFKNFDNIELIPTSDPLIYTIPDGGIILGYYNIAKALELNEVKINE